MEKLEKVFLILGIIALVNFIMFFMGVFSRMATDGFDLDILIQIFPVNKLIMVIISFSAYFIVKYARSKKENKKL
jgi:hypothetical protein